MLTAKDTILKQPNPATPQPKVEPPKVETGTKETHVLKPITESEAYFSEDIEAEELQMPDLLNVIPVDPEIEFRWVERSTSQGRRYRQMLAMGFQNAVPEDVKNLDRASLLVDGGTIISDDTILMKINKRKLYGAYKSNMQKARGMTQRKNVTEKAAQEGFSKEIGSIPSEHKGKVRFFNVGDDEADARAVPQPQG